MANHVVSEMDIQIGGRVFTLRPSFRALSEIEDRAGCSVLKIASQISDGDIKLKHILAIVWGGYIGSLAKSQKPDLSYEEMGEMLYKSNYMSLVPKIVSFFGAAIKGDPDNPPEPQEKKTV